MNIISTFAPPVNPKGEAIMRLSQEKPTALDVLLDNIPSELRGLPNWVLWQHQWDREKWTKTPIVVGSRSLASSTDSSTWSGFDEAAAEYDLYPYGSHWPYQGLMFAFPDDGELVGVDLDKCRNAETGVIDKWAADIIALLNTYTEVSPSGTGVKLWLYGHLNSERHRVDKIEIYSRKRFFCLTGHKLDNAPGIVESRQRELDELVNRLWGSQENVDTNGPPRDLKTSSKRHIRRLGDSEIIFRAASAKNGKGEKFERLWGGDTSDYASDHSRADLALCNVLAFYTDGDAERIDVLFRQSRLYRLKWERADYRDRTIRKAIENLEEYRRRRHSPRRQSNELAGDNTSVATTAIGMGGLTLPPDKQGPGDVANQYLINFEEVEHDGGKPTRIGLTAAQIKRQLDQIASNWPKRVGSNLFVPGGDGAPLWLESTDELFAWVNEQLSRNETNGVIWARDRDNVTQSQFFQFLAQNAEAFEGVEVIPHFPPFRNHYYMHPPVAGGDGTALNWLLDRFCPATRQDRALILAFLLTLVWGGQPGRRPAFLLEAVPGDRVAGRGVGKTKLAQIGAALVGGHIDFRPNENSEHIRTRLLSPAALSLRVAMIDNIKTLKLSCADLESLITADVISGRGLYVGEGRRPNLLIWVLTSNRATLSRDMAQRCVPIRLARPALDARWEEDTFEFIRDHRWEILGDLIAELKRTPPPTCVVTRWSPWEREVLAHVEDPAACAQMILARQAAVDGDDDEQATVRDAFMRAIREIGKNPETDVMRFVTADVIKIVEDATHEHHGTRTSSYLNTLAIDELRKCDRGDSRGWLWRGANAEAGAPEHQFVAGSWPPPRAMPLPRRQRPQ